MLTSETKLAIGYSAVAQGHVAAVTTSLEMTAPPTRSASPTGLAPPYELAVLERSELAPYRDLFRKVGEAWLWSSRLIMPDADLRAILDDPHVDIFVLRHAGETVGLLELDFRQAGECELAFFGLVPPAIGKGLGRALMNEAIARAWMRPIKRLWVHTCTFDHPGARAFYMRSGFRPYAVHVEVMADPRLTGHLPRHCAPHVALIDDVNPAPMQRLSHDAAALEA
jgi:GNAT superfamily N-acetyltransferase